jgi:hypothetical protein
MLWFIFCRSWSAKLTTRSVLSHSSFFLLPMLWKYSSRNLIHFCNHISLDAALWPSSLTVWSKFYLHHRARWPNIKLFSRPTLLCLMSILLFDSAKKSHRASSETFLLVPEGHKFNMS